MNVRNLIERSKHALDRKRVAYQQEETEALAEFGIIERYGYLADRLAERRTSFAELEKVIKARCDYDLIPQMTHELMSDWALRFDSVTVQLAAHESFVRNSPRLLEEFRARMIGDSEKELADFKSQNLKTLEKHSII